METLNPLLRYLGPYITVCNYWNYFWTSSGRPHHRAGRDRHGRARAAQPGRQRRRQRRRPGRDRAGQRRDLRPASGGVHAVPARQPYGAAVDATATPTARPASAATRAAQPRSATPRRQPRSSTRTRRATRARRTRGRPRVPGAARPTSARPQTGRQRPSRHPRDAADEAPRSQRTEPLRRRR